MTESRHGAVVVSGSALALFFPGALIFGFPGVMGPYWQQVFQVGRGAIGNILFFLLAAVGLFMFLVGKWQEKLGVRRMIAIGGVICALNLLLLSSADGLIFLYLWGFLNGVASSFIYIPALTTVQRWYPARRGLVSGIVNLSFGIAAAVLSPFFVWLLEAIGYRPMLYLVSAVTMIVGLLAASLVKMPPIMDQPPPPMAEEKIGPSPVQDRAFTASEGLRTRAFWLLWSTWALAGAAGIAMVTLSVSFGLSRGFTLEAAVMILTAFNLTNGLGRLLVGHLSDIIGRNITMAAALFLAAGSYFILPHVTSLLVAAVLASLVGLSFGTLFAVSAPLAADCFGLTYFGAIFGLIFTAYGFISGLIGPSLSGYLLDATQGNFTLVFSYLGVCCALAGIFILGVVPPMKQPPLVISKERR